MSFKNFLLFIGLATLVACSPNAEDTEESARWTSLAPAGDRYVEINAEGATIIPNGRLITPRGKTVRVAPHPYGLILSPDGKMAISANSGTGPFSISIIENIEADELSVRQIPEGARTDDDLLGAVFMGLAISPDNQTVYVAGGQENKIFVFDIASGQPRGEINCAVVTPEGIDYTHGYIGDMKLSQDGSTLYAVDQIGFRLLVIDVASRKILKNVRTGRYPFGISLSPDGQKIYVANVGMFEYQAIGGLTEDNLKEQGLRFPASAYGSEAMRDGVKNDSVDIPALGDPNAPESFSVWTVDLQQDTTVTARIKTGILVGQMVEDFPAVGGASPNSLVATEDYVFVSNGNNDCISVISTTQDTVVNNIYLQPDQRLNYLRGIIPFGLALSPDQKRLYVAESGINAVGVIDLEKMETIGHIPVGWFPSKLAVTPDGQQLIVANAKGYGSGPNGGPDFELGPEGSNIGRLMKGSITVMDIPSDEELAETTQQVIANNFNFVRVDDEQFAERKDNPVPLYPGEKESPIKYIVFISKENRTYDEVFGQISAGRGEPSLARYGRNVTFSNKTQTQTVEDADVMINHHLLAKRFAMSDNFYVDSDHSADGHRWLVNTYPNEWVETSVAASYGGKRGSRMNSKAPGNFGIVGASGAIYPEDYNEAGSIWDHFERNDISFFNFGFGVELANSYADSTLKYFGVRPLVNYPVPGPMYDRTSKMYATYNMGIPDQFRADVFMQEFEEKWMGEGKTMPQVLTIILPNDHGSGERPEAGFPFRESYMMDNDLALGRIVEFLSHTPYWENMAIIITEDDSQDGVDHIDAHRSLLMVCSPYAKKDFVSHQHYSFGSIFKTFWNILGTPYLNQYDAGASDLSDMFTAEADFTPYDAVMVDTRAFDPQKALDPFDENFDWEAVIESPDLDDPEDFQKAADERDLETIKERERLSNPRRNDPQP
jgi:DNA-binding beta-propeller fold protein YncE